MSMKPAFTRFSAVLISSALIFTSLSIPNAAQASVTLTPAAKFAERLGIPRQLGFVTDSWLPPLSAQKGRKGEGEKEFSASPLHPFPPSPMVVLIQDLHLHYPTQKRILRLLNYLFEKQIVSGSVAVEGAQGVYDTSVLANYPASKSKEKLVDYFMRQGELSGDEAFAVLRGEGQRLFGVDHASYYSVNRELYKTTFSNRKTLQAQLAKIEKKLAALKKHHPSAELLAKLGEIEQSLGYLSKLLNQRTTLEEVRHVAQRLPQFVELTEKLLKLNSASAKDIEETLKASVDFYAVALMRDKSLAVNTLNLLSDSRPTSDVRRRTSDVGRSIALVVGGFHTAGVTREFKQAGVGYIVVTPRLNEVSEDYHKLYESRMNGEHVSMDRVAQDLRLPRARTRLGNANEEDAVRVMANWSYLNFIAQSYFASRLNASLLSRLSRASAPVFRQAKKHPYITAGLVGLFLGGVGRYVFGPYGAAAAAVPFVGAARFGEPDPDDEDLTHLVPGLRADPELARQLLVSRFGNPVRHEISSVAEHFKSGRMPTVEQESHLHEPSRFALLAPQWIAVILSAAKLIGIAEGVKDKKQVEKLKENADLVAQTVQDQVAHELGLELQHILFETKGEITGGVESGHVGGRRDGVNTAVITDPIENTSAFAMNKPGASSMHLEGDGARTFGNFPDEARALIVVANVDRNQTTDSILDAAGQTLQEYLDPRLDAGELVRRVAKLNGTSVNNVVVTVLPNGDGKGGQREVRALERLRGFYPQMEINILTGGTVRPSIPAALGLKSGKLQVFVGRSGMTEAVWMTYFASLYRETGAFAGFRVVRQAIKENFVLGFEWPSDDPVLAKLKILQPDRWPSIVSPEGRIYSSEDQMNGEMGGSYTFLTQGEIDAQWPFEVPPVRQIEEGGSRPLYAVNSLEFSSGGLLWMSKDTYDFSRRAAGRAEMVRKVQQLSRVPDGIVAGEGLPDSYGRVFRPDSRYFTADGEMTQDLHRFIDSLSDLSVQEMIKAGIMYYDIRSGFWREHPEFTVVFAQAFAKKVQEKNGKSDGLIIHIAVDAYQHHFEAAQVFADAILRTGITDNGGGIYYWGVRNGGSIRNYAQLYQATHQAGGDWVFFTQSHRTETDLIGAKLGINGEVFCGPEIRHVGDVTSGTLFDGIIDVANGHAPIKHKAEGPVVNVADTFKNDLKVAADMIRATSARGKENVPDDQLLAGARLYVPVMGRSIAMDVVKILRGLGADVAVDSEEVNVNVSPAEVIDPNEHHEHHVLEVKKRIDEFAAAGDPRVAVFVDPDGDRGGLASKDGDKPADDMPGSEVVQLVIENLASSGKPVTAISDMRTGVGAKDLERALQKEGRKVRVVPFEAGYSFFMRGMSELPADVAIENTLHFFTNPMTNATWGAPQTLTRPNGKGFQGGDDAGLSSAYMIGAMVHQWEGRTPLEQLRWIQHRYQLAPTVTGERKPALKREDDTQKYHIADRMKQLAKLWFGESSDFQVNFNDPNVTVVSGVHIVNNRTGAMVLVRYSNSGPGFTISGEAYKGPEGREREQLDEMLGVGYLLMDTAIQQLREEGHEFTFDWKDAANLSGAFDGTKYGLDIPRQKPGGISGSTARMLGYLTVGLGAGTLGIAKVFGQDFVTRGVQTGDSNNAMLFAAVMAFAFLAVVVIPAAIAFYRWLVKPRQTAASKNDDDDPGLGSGVGSLTLPNMKQPPAPPKSGALGSRRIKMLLVKLLRKEEQPEALANLDRTSMAILLAQA